MPLMSAATTLGIGLGGVLHAFAEDYGKRAAVELRFPAISLLLIVFGFMLI